MFMRNASHPRYRSNPRRYGFTMPDAPSLRASGSPSFDIGSAIGAAVGGVATALQGALTSNLALVGSIMGGMTALGVVLRWVRKATHAR